MLHEPAAVAADDERRDAAEGDAPLKRIFDAAESSGGIEFYLIEQEHPGTITELEMAQKCLDNYRKLRTT